MIWPQAEMSQRWRLSIWCIALSALGVAAQTPPVLSYSSPPDFLKLSGTNPEDFTATDVNAGIQIYPFRGAARSALGAGLRRRGR
jgi:hypothetical protein